MCFIVCLVQLSPKDTKLLGGACRAQYAFCLLRVPAPFGPNLVHEPGYRAELRLLGT